MSSIVVSISEGRLPYSGVYPVYTLLSHTEEGLVGVEFGKFTFWADILHSFRSLNKWIRYVFLYDFQGVEVAVT